MAYIFLPIQPAIWRVMTWNNYAPGRPEESWPFGTSSINFGHAVFTAGA